MIKKMILYPACILCCLTAVTLSFGVSSAEMTADEFEASLNYQQGEITLPGGIATLQLDSNFRYLNPEDTDRVLVQAWGNPPGYETMGMLFHSDVSPVNEDGWGIIISYEKDGYVSDKDADSINYGEMITEMKEATTAANKERAKEGYEPVYLIGWAEKPYYDKESHKLYWAKKLQFGQDQDNTLNYNIRILGRNGVLVLNAVAGMNQLAQVQDEMQQVLAFTDFNSGHRYADFNPETDKMAAYGIAALVAGGIAGKMGLFAKIGAILFAAKKFIIVIVIAICGFAMRIFMNKKESRRVAS